MALILSSYLIGLLFGLGLIVSRMIDPAKVLGFLDIFGAWDPSLAFVMGGAVMVSTLGFLYARRRGAALLVSKLEIPTRNDLDARLVAGAAIFGLGWGLVGICPGPALTILSLGQWQAAVFVVALLSGMALFRLVPAAGPGATPNTATQGADA